jgi:hypothetical protein
MASRTVTRDAFMVLAFSMYGLTHYPFILARKGRAAH